MFDIWMAVLTVLILLFMVLFCVCVSVVSYIILKDGDNHV